MESNSHRKALALSADWKVAGRANGFALLVILFLCSASPCALGDSASGIQADSKNVYQVFLRNWVVDEEGPINVSRVVSPLTPRDLEAYAKCASDLGYEKPLAPVGSSINALDRSIDDVKDVEFVDPKTWRPTDPEELIAKGQSIESAVKQGFGGGLLTLSAIAFDKSGQSAALGYSFVCGELCGHDGVAFFRKSSNGWVQDKRPCGGWIS